MTTVLVTGYGPFAHTPVNPAEVVARALDGTTIAGARVVGAVVPNVFFTVLEVVQAKIAEVRPAAVLMLGVPFRARAVRASFGADVLSAAECRTNLHAALPDPLVDVHVPGVAFPLIADRQPAISPCPPAPGREPGITNDFVVHLLVMATLEVLPSRDIQYRLVAGIVVASPGKELQGVSGKQDIIFDVDHEVIETMRPAALSESRSQALVGILSAAESLAVLDDRDAV